MSFGHTEGWYVDNTETITHISLCAGYGGIELGLKRVLPALRTVAFCEIEAFAVANLVAKMEAGLMDPAPIWTDLKTFPWETFRDRVDILTGGYPCQPFSAAGKRLGAEDPRHLWPYIASGIRLLRPRLCFFENVEGHITLGLSTVISDLEELGYKVSWGIFSAAEVGAPHQRKRVFVLAELANAGFGPRCAQQWQQQEKRAKEFQRSAELAIAGGFGGATGFSGQVARHERQSGVANNGCPEIWPSRPGEVQHAWEPPRVVGNAESGLSGIKKAWNGREGAGRTSETDIMGNASNAGCKGGGGAHDSRREAHGSSISNGSGSDRRMEQGQRQTESPLGRNTDGTPSGLDYAQLCVAGDNRTDELRLLGNGVVPATAARAFLTLIS